MLITYDPNKRAETLEHRSLDFEDAPKVFAGPHYEIEDDRRNYGETRWITVGRLDGTMVVVVWTPRSEGRRIISMRKSNAREQEKYRAHLDGSR